MSVNPSPVQFILKAFIVAAVVMWGLTTFVRPVAEENLEQSIPQAKVLEFAASILPLSGEDTLARVEQAAKAKKPVMIVVYASWCSVCRAIMPEIIDVLREHDAKQRPYELIMLSLDRKSDDLSRYLIKNGLENDFMPYIHRAVGSKILPDYLARAGMKFDSRIPYFAFFGKDGKLAREVTGGMDKQQLREALKSVL